jgi:hydroxypyruvate reductase
VPSARHRPGQCPWDKRCRRCGDGYAPHAGGNAKAAAANDFAKADKWPTQGFERTHTIGGKKLGIIGLGRIGRKIAERAQAFDMEIAWHGPSDKPDVDWRYFPDHLALADWSDFLVLSCPGGDATRHLISTKELQALGPQGILVSVARGSVVDPDAVIKALQEKTIFGAGLDVFEGEPHLPEALRALDNVILTPHLGAITHEAFDNGRDLLLENLRAHFSRKPVLTPVVLTDT